MPHQFFQLSYLILMLLFLIRCQRAGWAYSIRHSTLDSTCHLKETRPKFKLGLNRTAGRGFLATFVQNNTLVIPESITSCCLSGNMRTRWSVIDKLTYKFSVVACRSWSFLAIWCSSWISYVPKLIMLTCLTILSIEIALIIYISDAKSLQFVTRFWIVGRWGHD